MSVFCKRIMAATLCAFLLVPMLGAGQPEPADALHFIVRHWHSAEDTDTKFQGESTVQSNDRYFVVAEGYIVPDKGTYKFYLVYQSDTADGHKAGDMEEITENDGFVSNSTYIEDIDPIKGSITLKPSPVKREGIYEEHFSTFSVSAGHHAVTYGNDSLTITYDKYVHLVKVHVFYVRDMMEVNGIDDETVFGQNGVGKNSERDTAWIHANGNAELTKVYDTSEGMHTDKTASVVQGGDNRTFNLDLEAWYAEGYAPQVGMILDASGSMGFASDSPTAINALSALGIKKDGNGGYVYMDGGKITDRTLISLIGKIGALMVDGDKDYVYPKRNKMIGYYAFNQASKEHPEDTTARDWLKNGVNGKFASKLQNQVNFTGNYTFKADTADVTNGWPDDHRDLSLSNVNGGLEISYGGYTGQNGKTAPTGILLDAQPAGTNFTVSFTMNTTNYKSQADSLAEILYIGSMSGNVSEGGYYRAYRDEGSSSARFRGGASSGRINSLITDINSVFQTGSPSQTVITLVFEDGTVTSYLNGVVGIQNSTVGEGVNKGSAFKFRKDDDIRIIFDGIADSYSNEYGKLCVDDIFIYDTALRAQEVKQLYDAVKAKADIDAVKSDNINWETDVFLSGDELALLLNPHNTDNSPLGVSGYNYFIFNPNDKTQEYSPLAYWEGRESESKATKRDNGNNTTIYIARNGGNVIGALGNGTFVNSGAGWYTMNPTSYWNSNYVLEGLESGKVIWGITAGQKFTDNILKERPAGADPKANSGRIYTVPTGKNPSVPFYIDGDGYLRCFVSTNAYTDSPNANNFASYVYELSDSEYVKVESLQRAIGLFVTELNEAIPSSQVSAVRFSTNYIPDNELDKLVLLDWTDDPGESADILSLRRGNGGTIEGTAGSHTVNGKRVMQYNYGLTGETSTWRGLQSFFDNLLPNDGVPDAPKSLILFTDGLDTERDKENEKDYARELADKLKAEPYNYTIFTVMLNGGSVKEGTEQYEKAHEFLLSLSGNRDTITDDQKEQYFFSVSKAKAELEERDPGSANGMNDTDILTEIFTEEILDLIVKPLTDYTITDYIDPRFDLVDKDGVVWHLNAGGNVLKYDGAIADSKITVTSDSQTTIALSVVSDLNARNPYLRYDSNKDMYYLEWEDQVIPTCAIGANRLSVWNARIILRAKDDFIGGNAVLTNGNEAGMNWVHHLDDNYPSKGFPRTVVNISPTSKSFIDSQTIYMGEELNEAFIAQNLFDAVQSKVEEDQLAKYYWEYLGRYANDTGQASDALLRQLTEDGGLELPYYYIRNADRTNQTGTKAHERDLLGYLKYNLDMTYWGTGYPSDSIVRDRWSRGTQLTVTFDPLPIAGSLQSNNRTEENKQLVVETDRNGNRIYQWDPEYKPADDGTVGAVQTETDLIGCVYYTKVVSGEVQLQLGLGMEAAEALQGSTITYTADLMREYDGLKEKTGTLEIKMDDVSGEAERNTASFTPNVGYAYMDYNVSNDLENGLAIGTYTLENGKGTVTKDGIEVSGYEFGEIAVVPNSGINSPYAEEGLFTKGSDHDDPELAEKFVAVIDTAENQAVLGDKTAATGKAYTDYRFGLFRVELNPVSEPALPPGQSDPDPVSPEQVDTAKTSDDSRLGIWFLLMVGSLTGLVAFFYTELKRNRE